MNDDRPTPTRPHLSAVTNETNGTGRDPRAEISPERETQAERLERAILETHGMIHNVAVAVENVKLDQSKMRGDLALIRHEQHRLATQLTTSHSLSTVRAKLESVSDITFDDGVESFTEHGTRTFTYTEEALRAKMRAEIVARENARELERDAAPKRFVVGQLIPHVTKGAGLVAVTAVLGALWARLVAYFTHH